MALMKEWYDMAYSERIDKNKLKKLWDEYFVREKEMYEKLLEDPGTYIKGSVKELAGKFGVDIMTMTGFLDGIDTSLKNPNPLDEIEEDSEVNLDFDRELLYKNMVAVDANWLYGLPQWDAILTEERRHELYKEQRASRNVRKAPKIYPNDPCPCGSGKKFKKCHGKPGVNRYEGSESENG